ncbi:hypothetical protein SBA2_1090004 [Acidobacteriia bacterium SbA2]|nr:hypothetical protein SBA2_1090004 [Acidobacteriia bacterium SbA2]
MLEQDGGLARARLNTLLGRDPGSPLEVQGQYSPPQKLPSLLDLEKSALENRPELAMASSGVRQGETRTKLAEKSYTPETAGATTPRSPRRRRMSRLREPSSTTSARSSSRKSRKL